MYSDRYEHHTKPFVKPTPETKSLTAKRVAVLKGYSIKEL